MIFNKLFGKTFKVWFLLGSLAILLWSCKQQESTHEITQDSNRVEIENSKVKAVFKKENGHVSQIFYAKKNDQWQEVEPKELHQRTPFLLWKYSYGPEN